MLIGSIKQKQGEEKESEGEGSFRSADQRGQPGGGGICTDLKERRAQLFELVEKQSFWAERIAPGHIRRWSMLVMLGKQQGAQGICW